MDNPYVGLDAFGMDDADRFFGRAREARDLAYLWRSNRVVILFGPSGIGKTSLLRAGAIPRLRTSRIDLLPIGRLAPSSSFPAPNLEDHNPYIFSLLSSWLPGESPAALVGKSISEFLLDRFRTIGRYGEPVPIFAAIDQYEEVLNTPPIWQRHAERFRAELSRAAKDLPNLRLLISVRGDAVSGMLDRETELSMEHQAWMRLNPLSPKEALSAIVDPAKDTRRSYRRAAAELLIQDLRTVQARDVLGTVHKVEVDAVEPWQLQLVCAELWDRLPPECEVIGVADIQDFSDVGQTLLDTYQDAVTTIATHFKISPSELHRWVEEQFVTEHGTRAQVYEGRQQTRGMPNPVPQELERKRILRSDWRYGTRWFELQHDRLIEPVQRANQLAHAENGDTAARSSATRSRPAECLEAAEGALAEGYLGLADRYASEAARLAEESGTNESVWIWAEAESFIGNVAFHRDRLDAAQLHYDQAANLFERLQAPSAVARLLAATGRIHQRRGDSSQAVERFQSALNRLPGDQSIRLDLARANWRAGQLQAARGLLNQILVAVPGHSDALADRGQIEVELLEFQDALTSLDNLIRRYPSRQRSPEVRAAHAVALAGIGRTEEASAEIQEALLTASENGQVLLYAAWVAQKCGDGKNARKLARQASEATDPPLSGHLFSRVQGILRARLG
ncbi:tetratricopeptide repeat protein [Streptosporangiaceae bacterium NEAU-GS5]|nr:tetratricopeptide repeat protein [Streptosporangiaceae bacterium NEAU-GS5]